MATLRLTSAEEVRATIAAHVLGGTSGNGTLGSVVLRAHQVEAVSRLDRIIRQHGGALLADEVGLGKTFVGLAVATRFGRPAVVAPASLRPMWRNASSRSGVELRFVSMEMLGHGATVPSNDFIIVDEAHHFRNPATRRYAQLASASALKPVLMLSATPVQNSLDDLRSLAALILGRRALAMSIADLMALVIRRGAASLARDTDLPEVEAPRWVSVRSELDCLEQICALPPAVPPSDGKLAATLLTFSLVRQWASSHAALLGALMRRLAMSHAMEDALSAGKQLSRSELAAWRFADGAQQLSFPELATEFRAAGAELLEQVRRHADGLRELIAQVRARTDIDRDRANQLREIAERHAGKRIVAFSEFTETVGAMYQDLSRTHRAAMLTHGGGRVAGGRVTRHEVLAQFAGSPSAPEHSRIDLLLTTDVLSEGVDLQGASVIVHLDLSWNPARMEQRVGRLRRPGAAGDSIAVYLFAPPAPTERLLELDRRLREKLGEAARSIGIAGSILPGHAPLENSALRERERVRGIMHEWLRPGKRLDFVAAAVSSFMSGAIACVRRDGEVVLVSIQQGQVHPSVPTELLTAATNGSPQLVADTDVSRAMDTLSAWIARRALTQVVELPASNLARSRRRILTRVNGIVRRARRHERSSWSTMLGAARLAATVTMPVGAERVLDELARAPMSDEAWLRAVGEFGSIHGQRRSGEPDEVLALLLLQSG